MEVVVINGSITDQEEAYYIEFIKLYEPNCHKLEVIVKDDRTVHLVPHVKTVMYANISRPTTLPSSPAKTSNLGVKDIENIIENLRRNK